MVLALPGARLGAQDLVQCHPAHSLPQHRVPGTAQIQHSGTYVDLGSVEPVLVNDPANEAEASEPASPAGRDRGEAGERGEPLPAAQTVGEERPSQQPEGTSWAGTSSQGGQGRGHGRRAHGATGMEESRARSLLGAPSGHRLPRLCPAPERLHLPGEYFYQAK